MPNIFDILASEQNPLPPSVAAPANIFEELAGGLRFDEEVDETNHIRAAAAEIRRLEFVTGAPVPALAKQAIVDNFRAKVGFPRLLGRDHFRRGLQAHNASNPFASYAAGVGESLTGAGANVTALFSPEAAQRLRARNAAYYGPASGAAGAVGGAVGTIAQAIPALATGPLGAAAMFGTLGAGGGRLSAADARDRGIEVGVAEEVQTAITQGVVEGLSGFFGAKLLGPLGERLGKLSTGAIEAFRKGGVSQARAYLASGARTALEAAGLAAGEGLEEATTQFVTNVIQRTWIDESQPLFGGVLESGVTGAAVSPILGPIAHRIAPGVRAGRSPQPDGLAGGGPQRPRRTDQHRIGRRVEAEVEQAARLEAQVDLAVRELAQLQGKEPEARLFLERQDELNLERLVDEADGASEAVAFVEPELVNLGLVNQFVGREAGDELLLAAADAVKLAVRLPPQKGRPADQVNLGQRVGPPAVRLRNITEPAQIDAAFQRASAEFDAAVDRVVGDRLPPSARPFLSWGSAIREPGDLRTAADLVEEAKSARAQGRRDRKAARGVPGRRRAARDAQAWTAARAAAAEAAATVEAGNLEAAAARVETQQAGARLIGRRVQGGTIESVDGDQAVVVRPDDPTATPVTVPLSSLHPDAPAESGGTRDPNPVVQGHAESYLKKIGRRVRRFFYHPVNEARARRIAALYEAMEHNPNDPETAASYEAFKRETLAQWEHITAQGVVMEPWTEEGQPYANSAEMRADVRRGHLGFFTDAKLPADHPLAAASPVIVNGRHLLYNDIFRAVHDYFGHAREGVGFGPRGEEGAWESHSAMYGSLARRAMTTETRGQNSWVNFGPLGEQNQADPANTTYAEQKAGLLPRWVSHSSSEPTPASAEEDRSRTIVKVTGAPTPIPRDPTTAIVAVDRATEITRSGIRVREDDIPPGSELAVARTEIEQLGPGGPGGGGGGLARRGGLVGPVGGGGGGGLVGPGTGPGAGGWFPNIRHGFREFRQGIEDYLTPIISRINAISPAVAGRLLQLETGIRFRRATFQRHAAEFLRMKNDALPERERAVWERAVMNGDFRLANQLLRQHGGQDLVTRFVRITVMLEGLRRGMNAAGANVGRIPNYWPRWVKDWEGLSGFLTGEEASEFRRVAKEEARRRGRPLTPEETVDVWNRMAMGLGSTVKISGVQRPRVIGRVEPETVGFYASADEAIMHYVDKAVQIIEKRRFFGRTAHPLATMSESVGAYVEALRQRGLVSARDGSTLVDLLVSRFGTGEMPSSRWVRTFRNFGYLTTLANPISALTQFADLFLGAVDNGIVSQLAGFRAAINRRGIFTMENMGIERIGAEFMEAGSLHDFLETSFKVSGFAAVDRLGKETRMNAAFDRARRAVVDPSSERFRAFARRWVPVFGVAEFANIVADLQQGRVTDNVRVLVFTELSRVQPISLSDVPKKYLDAPNGRLFYMLKTFTIKQWDFLRRGAFERMIRGIRRNDPAEAGRGAAFLLRYALFFGLGNAGVEFIKRWLFGRPLQVDDLSDFAVDNLWRMFGGSKFLADKSAREGFWGAFAAWLMPPGNIIDEATRDVKRMPDIITGKQTVQDLELVRRIPFVGSYLYFGVGPEGVGAVGRGRKRFEEERSRKPARHRRAAYTRAVDALKAGSETSARAIVEKFNEERGSAPRIKMSTVRQAAHPR